MTKEKLLEYFDDRVKKMRAKLEQKNHDYTNDNLRDALANFKCVDALSICSTKQGALVRLTDKLARCATFAHRELKVDDESVDDTVIDGANYFLIYGAICAEEMEAM